MRYNQLQAERDSSGMLQVGRRLALVLCEGLPFAWLA